MKLFHLLFIHICPLLAHNKNDLIEADSFEHAGVQLEMEHVDTNRGDQFLESGFILRSPERKKKLGFDIKKMLKSSKIVKNNDKIELVGKRAGINHQDYGFILRSPQRSKKSSPGKSSK